MKKRSFSQQFKQDAVNLTGQGKSLREVAQSLDEPSHRNGERLAL